MKEFVLSWLESFDCHSSHDYQVALKEIMQNIALLGLWRAKFFEVAAFYGGTSLRLLFGSDRFSEDLDFSLLHPNPSFRLSVYTSAIQKELTSYGFEVQIIEGSDGRAVDSAFIKAGTLYQMLQIDVAQSITSRIPKSQKLTIKIEIDRDPPPGFSTMIRYLLRPIEFSVKVYQLPDLFAGKLHAILCRSWKNRVKGRDWFDLIWFVKHHTPCHLDHLASRLIQSGHWSADQELTLDRFQSLLKDKIFRTNFEMARQDVAPFIADPTRLQIWSGDFFLSLVPQILVI